MEALENNNTEKELSLQEIIEKIKSIAATECNDSTKNEATSLKKLFYLTLNKCRFSQNADENNSDDYNALEEEFKTQYNTYHEKRNKFVEDKTKEENDNLNKRKSIIENIKSFAADTEKTHEHFNELKALQQEWKEIGAVPATEKTAIYKEYNAANEQYYDQLKINIELREYDFKKNLEAKTELCEKAEALDKEENVIEAFNTLQGLHEQWAQTGPVDKEQREEIWNRFKEASTVINKKHNAYFEERKKKEQEAIKTKEEICTKIEAVDTTGAATASDWEKLTEAVKGLQQEWKNAGFTPAKISEEVYERYRTACNKFFELKSAFYGKINEERKANKKIKQELINKAKELKDSADWKATAQALEELQKKWKETGPVPTREAQAMWKEFIGACDEFFTKRKEAFDSRKNEEKENLDKKKSIIEQIENFKPLESAKESAETIKKLMADFNATGHVPYAEKDELHRKFRKAVDKVFDALKINDENRPTDIAKLRRTAEKLRNEIKTAENNILFLTPANSKRSNPLIEDMKRNIEKMKKDLRSTLNKIESNEKKA